MSERVYLKQNSPEWLEYRFDHRNASEAGTVMRCNPFQTVENLRKIKKDRKDTFVGNLATEYGHKHEPEARAKAEELLGIGLEDAVFKDGVYSASLDAYGESGNESIKVEIKCPYKQKDSHLWKQLQIEGDWTQRIPEYYVWQIVHQHMVKPTTQTWFLAYIPGGDFEWIQCFPSEEQIDKLKLAWEAFENPEEGSQEIDTDDARRLVYERAILKHKMSKLDKELKQVESELKRMAGEQDTLFANELRLVKKSRAGAINAKKLEADGINVDQYRGDDVQFMQFQQEK